MIHRILTCKNHPQLRWSCKDVAWSESPEGGHYNGSRNIFFNGVPSGQGMFPDGSGLDCDMFQGHQLVEECSCPASDLILAPEDGQVKRD